MSAHDDYFDVKDAFERWERAYVRWGNRADSDDRDELTTKKGREAEEKARRAAKTYLKACEYLAQQARNARTSMIGRGWAPSKTTKLCGKPDEDGDPCAEPALPKIKGLESVFTGFCDEHDREVIRQQLADLVAARERTLAIAQRSGESAKEVADGIKKRCGIE